MDAIVAYLDERWSRREVESFYKGYKNRRILSYRPEAYPLSEKSGGYRRYVLTSQTTIFYKFEDDTNIIRYVFDTRQDSNGLSLEE